MHTKAFPIALILTVIGLALFMQVPQWIHAMSPLSKGVLVELNSDEDLYLARVQEALTGRPGLAAEAITGDTHIVPAQGALIETFYGVAFAWTGMRAATVLQILDSIIVPLLFLTLVAFFRRAGFSPWQSYGGAVLFCVLHLYNLNRPIHQRDSFLLVLVSLIWLWDGLKGRRWLGILGGVVLGVLVGVYFWSFTFAWAAAGILFLLEGIAWIRSVRAEKQPSLWRRVLERLRPHHTAISSWQWLLLFLFIGVVAALPFALELLAQAKHPLYEVFRARTELLPGRLPESWMRSGLFLLMTVGVLGTAVRSQEFERRHRLALVIILTAFVVLHQQVIHGIVFLFSSHYLFGLTLAGICALLLSVQYLRRSWWLILSLVGSALFLLGLAWDSRYIISQMTPLPERFSEQHFATLLPVVDALPRATIFSDADTMRFLAGATKHDVPYTGRLNYMILSAEELAERYCLAKLPVREDNWHIGVETALIYDPDNIRLHPELREQEMTLVTETCRSMATMPAEMLRRYGVEYVVWDEERHPEWNLHRLGVPLFNIASGEGWSLWKL